jgi:hypothetical protein
MMVKSTPRTRLSFWRIEMFNADLMKKAEQTIKQADLGALLGAALAQNRAGWAKDRLRGAAKGVGTTLGGGLGVGMGALGGAGAGAGLEHLFGQQPFSGPAVPIGALLGALAGGGLGAYGGYRGASALTNVIGLNTPTQSYLDDERKRIEDLQREISPHHADKRASAFGARLGAQAAYR